MKKTVKIMSVLLLVTMLLASVGSVVFADTASSVLQQMNNAQNGIVQVVGVVIAVIIILVIGIKYMIGSAEEKAEYKKTMIPYLVGAILIFAGATIVNVVYNLVTGLR